jgi:hypothetical protein
VPVVRDAGGKDITASVHMQWTSSNTALATVSDSGVVFGVALGGPVTITGSTGGVTATALVTIVPAQIFITPVFRAIAVGTSAQLSAAAADAAGVPADGGAVTWSTTTPNLVTVSASGLLSALTPGSASVSAQIAGKTVTVSVFVGVPSNYDGTYQRQSNGDATQIVVFLGRVSSLAVTGHDGLFGCPLSVSEQPDAVIGNGTVLFTAASGIAVINASFDSTAHTVLGRLNQVRIASLPCVPPGVSPDVQTFVTFSGSR